MTRCKRGIDKERMSELLLAERSLAKVWDNPQDGEAWKRYL